MGYDESLFLKPLDAYWHCPICEDVLQDAVETPCCEKPFCHSCIQDWITTHQKSCPNCRAKLDVQQIAKRDKRTNKYIREQLVQCPQKDTHECVWTGHVGDIDDHVAHACQSGMVRCPFHEMGCHAKLPRSELSSHLQEQTSQHLTLSLLKIGEMGREISNLKRQADGVNELKKSVAQLKSEMLPIRNATMALSGSIVITIPRAEFLDTEWNKSIDGTPFEYAGFKWRIKVYPRGNLQEKEGYPSFFLWSEHDYERNPKGIETNFTLSFENRNHSNDTASKFTHGLLGAIYTFTKNNGNGWSLKSMNEQLTTSYIADPKNGFIHEEDDCLHIRTCILDVKPRSRTAK